MTYSPTPSFPSFLGLPLELQADILEKLDWKDILRVRKTCTALHEASRVRSIWLKLCHPYLTPTDTSPKKIHLERPIDLYTSEELEFLFVRLQGADSGWRRGGKYPARVREIATMKTRVPECTHLVEGGRWLLGASNTGSVTYFDLDASPITESVLIPDQFPIFTYPMWIHIAIDPDRGSAFLAFNLALSFCTAGTVVHPTRHSVQVWKVMLLCDGQQRGIGLAAHRLASFPQEPGISGVYSLSLCGPHIALAVFCHVMELRRRRAFVIDWLHANGDTTDYRRRLINPFESARGPSMLSLLPGNRLLTSTHHILMLFDYLDVEETSTLPPVHEPENKITAKELWYSCEEPLRDTSLSGPFFCLDSTRFTFQTHSDIRGLVINNDACKGQPAEEIAWLANLWSCPQDIDRGLVITFPVAYGYEKAAVIATPSQTYLPSFPWPNFHNRHLFQYSYLEKECLVDDDWLRNLEPLLDESSGRVVVPASISTCRHIIWDFSIRYRDNT